MTPAERRQRLLSHLPLVLQRGPTIGRVFDAIGGELAAMEGGTRRLLESRWYTLARGFDAGDALRSKAASELGLIGALFDLRPGRGEGDDQFRRHLAGLIRIHAEGLSTAPAILRLVAHAYLAEEPPVITWQGGAGGGVTAVATFPVVDRDGATRTLRVEVVDNPTVDAVARMRGARAEELLVTTNQGLDPAYPVVELKALEREVVVPLLTHVESGTDVIFVGTIPPGRTLTLTHGAAPLLDGQPTPAPLLVANPTRFGANPPPPDVARFGSARAPDARFSFCEVGHRLPRLPPGESRFRYRALSRAQLEAYLGGRAIAGVDVLTAPEVAAAPPLDITFRWMEVEPASFELRIPAGYVPPPYLLPDTEKGAPPPGLEGFVRDLQAALRYGRAAGVRARVGLMLPLAPEAVEIREGPLQIEITTSFAERQDVADELVATGSALDFRDRLPEPRDWLGFDGVFDQTRFDGSRFQ
jgi:hypothetical protein